MGETALSDVSTIATQVEVGECRSEEGDEAPTNEFTVRDSLTSVVLLARGMGSPVVLGTAWPDLTEEIGDEPDETDVNDDPDAADIWDERESADAEWSVVTTEGVGGDTLVTGNEMS
jgi:hypothetical protein